MRSKICVLCALLLSTVILAGCGSPPYADGFQVLAGRAGWTNDQITAATAYSYKYFSEAPDVNSEKNTDPLRDVDIKSTVKLPAIRYDLLGLDKLILRLDNWLDDFEILLDYNLPEEAKFVDVFGLRSSMQHDEKILRALRARVKAIQLDRNFKSMLKRTYSATDKAEGPVEYNIKQIFNTKNPLDVYKFNSNYIIEAKNAGVLRVIEQVRFQLQRKLDHKGKDPACMDDKNSFTWASSDREIEFVSQKIVFDDKSKDNVCDYIEGYRFRNGKREAYPCVKIFNVMKGASAPRSVFVIDTKMEGEPGFGLPEFVENMAGAVSAKDLAQDQKFLERIFEEPREKGRIAPKGKPVSIEIARAEIPMDIWETAKDRVKGFEVRFKYKTNPGADYNIKIELDKKVSDLERSIVYFKREWTNGGRFEPVLGDVVEYYRPRAPYDSLKYVGVKVLEHVNTKLILLLKADGTFEVGMINPGRNKFLEDKPVAIFYSEGDKRFVIKRSAGSAVFDKRRELPMSTMGKTGVY